MAKKKDEAAVIEPVREPMPTDGLEPGMPVQWSLEPNGHFYGAIIRRVNGDGTLSLYIFPHAYATAIKDAVPHIDSPLLQEEGRLPQGCWKPLNFYQRLVDEVAALKKQLDEVADLVTK